MNCKQGDLAVFVRSRAGNEGKIVRCLRLATAHELLAMRASPVETWITDAPLRDTFGEWTAMAPDAYLRPIRDPGEDATDETLIYAGKPVREGEPA